MRKSIFDLEIRIDIEYEFDNLKNLLLEQNTIWYQRTYYNLYEILNDEIFPVWKYKGVIIDFDDFCNRLNIDWAYHSCSKENFLYLIELLLNLWKIVELKVLPENEQYCSKRVLGYMKCSLPLIVEKMNYQILNEKDKCRIIKRDSDVDSILEVVPQNYADLLLDYNDIRNNNINAKKKILKDIDLYIEENLKKHKGNPTYESIGSIVNNLGINHPIKKKFQGMSEEDLCTWYDKCFKLMIHLIRMDVINKINEERNKFFINSGD